MRKPAVLDLLLVFIASSAFAQMKITSSAFQSGGQIPAKYTCDGPNVNPPLRIEGAPDNAKTLALLVEDPDAPGGTFTHWLIWNIDPKTSTIGEGGAPGGTQGNNDFGKTGYGGACPPSGTHRYYFKVFALDRQLDLQAGAKRRDLDAAMKGHVVAQGEVMGRYSKQK